MPALPRPHGQVVVASRAELPRQPRQPLLPRAWVHAAGQEARYWRQALTGWPLLQLASGQQLLMLPELSRRRKELLTKPPGQSAVAGWELVVVQQEQRGLTAEYGKKTAAD